MTKKDVEKILESMNNVPNEELKRAVQEYRQQFQEPTAIDKEQQAKLLSEIIEADERDGLYEYSGKIILDGLKEKKEELLEEIKELKTLLERAEEVKKELNCHYSGLPSTRSYEE